jgi:hypothetical protein
MNESVKIIPLHHDSYGVALAVLEVFLWGIGARQTSAMGDEQGRTVEDFLVLVCKLGKPKY